MDIHIHHGEEWSDAHSQLFRQAAAAVKLDLKRGTIIHWSSRLAHQMKCEIPYKDIFARLQLLRLELDSDDVLRSAVAQCDNEEEDPVVADLQSNQVLTKMSASDAIMTFQQSASDSMMTSQQFMREGPMTRCGSCGKLDFLTLMRTFTHDIHASLYPISNIQVKLHTCLSKSACLRSRSACLAIALSLNAKNLYFAVEAARPAISSLKLLLSSQISKQFLFPLV